ncbi:hypothetical protein NLX83_13115 [Allokutzneria sp. A3M-2-11 16]|uniref:hypothetical protein n=1 Tax=Allokutzneria sp. A3M-2-11 16 TaxID=2962043 RepID=UPI0020B830EC|nr:hypothetical protein [Allokutzneria sp. A3M-2-11 16]MCP3800199.1 hypothetical protein [Allokutzneria sp. A3M-2-11 16]
MSEAVTISMDDLSVGEIERIEDLIDASIDSIGAPGARKGKFLRAVAYVIALRDNPEFRYEDSYALRISLGDKENPPVAADAVAAPNRAARRARSPKPA